MDGGGDEPTEMTAMTAGDPGAESGSSGLASPSETIAEHHRKALLKRYLRSPQGKCVFSVVIVTLLGLAAYVVSKLIMGSIYMNSCQVDPFIPIYLVTSAVLLIAFIIILIITIIKCRREEGDDRVSPVHLVTFVYFFVHLVLQLAGSVCVIRTRNLLIDTAVNEDNPGTVGCDDVLMTYSFGVIIFELILSGLLFIFAVISLCEVIYTECCQSTHRKPPLTTSQ